ncbi:MAG: hypothetical protein WKF36_07270 [Candidatus Nitrosocosmicus sp.]
MMPANAKNTAKAHLSKFITNNRTRLFLRFAACCDVFDPSSNFT